MADAGASGEHKSLEEQALKTYEKILEKKEAEASQTALMELRAQVLTRRLLKAREDDEAEQANQMAMKSKAQYARSMAEAAQCKEKEELLKLSESEGKRCIDNTMREQKLLREQEVADAERQKRDQAYWAKARQAYEQGRSKARRDELEQRRKEANTSRRDADIKRKEACAEVMAEEKEKANAVLTREKERCAKAIETKRKADAESRKDLTQKTKDMEQRSKQADEKRQERDSKVRDANRTAEDRRAKIVDELREQEEKSHRELIQTIQEKEQYIKLRLEERQAKHEMMKQHASESGDDMQAKASARRRKTDDSGGAVATMVSNTAAAADTEPSHDHAELHVGAPRTRRYDDPELIHANMKAQKEYLQKKFEITQALDKMAYQKKFQKGLLDTAKAAESTPEKETTSMRRLKGVYNMYASPRRDAGDGSGSAEAPKLDRMKSVHPVLQRCHYCERSFPLEALPGSAFRGVVERLKAADGDSSTMSEPHSPAASARGAASQSQNDPAASVMTARELGRKNLYDFEVRLCVRCFHHVRFAGHS